MTTNIPTVDVLRDMGTADDGREAGCVEVLEYQGNNRALDFLAVKDACPKGMYLSPLPDDPSQWEGVLFVRKGPYAPAVFRFSIYFPVQYPTRPPLISFLSDVFHPLVSPLTTYLFSNQDTGADTVSATDQDRLSPGSFSLRHGYPQWFRRTVTEFQDDMNERSQGHANAGFSPTNLGSIVQPGKLHDNTWKPPHIAVILFYLRASFSSAGLLDSIPLEAAANPSAWHAWRTFSSKDANRSSSIRSKSDAGMTPVAALKQQPGGARSPGEWNWDGVWEDRLRKCIQASLAESAIFKKSGHVDELIQFLDLDRETSKNVASWTSQSSPAASLQSTEDHDSAV
ncbi:Ubiquitin-conjugating enzyme-like protein 8 [Elsinoe fawcettii]|nr:Ubiquitin-conjugating enzyme-like protein 8 [Elsinoe fawcettii]